MLTPCQQCKFCTVERIHSTDLGCAIVPAYWEAWQRLHPLSASTLGQIPIDECREFELSPRLQPETLSLTLTREQWAAITQSRRCPSELTQQIQQELGIEDRTSEMPMVEVISSNIRAIGYHHSSHTLQIDFLNGSQYRYFRVQVATFEDFLSATSKGRFLNARIKARYSYERIS